MRVKSIIPAATALILLSASCDEKEQTPIDRLLVVERHNVQNTAVDSLSSLSVGNGRFSFTADITGLQTFPGSYAGGIPLGTMAEWAWHSDPNPGNYSLADVYRSYDVHGRTVEYVHQFRAADGPVKWGATEWLRANPHKIHLGVIGLHILMSNGSEASINDIEDPHQVLDLTGGILQSTFSVEGKKVKVTTVCHPGQDIVSAAVESDLLKEDRLAVKIIFPHAVGLWSGFDFGSPEGHETILRKGEKGVAVFERLQDNDRYFLTLNHGGGEVKELKEHFYLVSPDTGSTSLKISCLFTKSDPGSVPPDFTSVSEASVKSWEDFWMSGGAVDFSGCTDPRAKELERRIVLSRYLTRIQCSGSLPPAETGLTYNSWFGKFHLEMHWWHAVHFALWQKADILENQMGYYEDIIGNARQTAAHQGYRGVRWPKMTDPEGRESPSGVGTYLIWQQPHPIFFAELLYLNAADRKAVLDKYSKLVFETADFMASYAWRDSTGRYILGPVLIPAQESLNRETTINPVFEIVYWHWGLKTAIEWKRRMGEKPDPLWTDVYRNLAELPVMDGLYLCSEDTRDSYTNPRYMSDHPIVSGIKGVMPDTRLVDDRILGNSLDTILKKWNWRSTWGWDFPMLAMAAASIGREEQAVDFLLMDAPKNRYLANGHNYQDARLALYLPGNGGLLTAVAKMCVEGNFPHNGKWNVRWENLNEYVR
ncbi:MAG: hypothetical protein MUE74_07195 [Bacteroidales bacterium]|nr:hypothetical protein [Bacteroidales bacterium]